MNDAVNFMTMNANPSLLSEDQTEIITYTPDMTYYKFLDPLISQQTNIFLMESTISIKDNIYDLFDTSETEHKLIEEAFRSDYHRRNADDTDIADRAYLEIYLRANN